MDTTCIGPTRDRLATAGLQGVAVAGWVAVPDYVHTPRARRLARAGVAAATVAAGLLVVRPWEASAAAPPPAPMHDAETATRDAEAATTPSPDPDAFTRLLDAATHPYEEREEWADLAAPAPPDAGPFVTYCGT